MITTIRSPHVMVPGFEGAAVVGICVGASVGDTVGMDVGAGVGEGVGFAPITPGTPARTSRLLTNLDAQIHPSKKKKPYDCFDSVADAWCSKESRCNQYRGSRLFRGNHDPFMIIT
eukprot:1077622_1